MAERVFLGWEEPALAAAARHLSREALADGLVVLPGARAGRRLTELLLEEAEHRGSALSPPRVVTVGALPEELYEPRRPPASDTLATRVWAAALRGLEPDLRAEIFPEPPDPDDLAGWQRLAGILRRLHREVGREGRDFAEVEAHCRREGPPGEVRRWQALAAVQRDYRRRLDDLGRTDRQDARGRALEDGEIRLRPGPGGSPPRDAGGAAGAGGGAPRAPVDGAGIWLVGVVELPGLVRGMLEAVEEPVRALVHAPESEAGGFDHLGCVRPGAWRDRDRNLAGDDLRVCRGPAGQADAVLDALAAGGGGQEAPRPRRREGTGGAGTTWAPDQVTVGVPDREVVPYLSHRLSSLEVPHRYAEGTPMRETRPYRLLDAVAAYLDGHRWVDLAALVRHPDVEPLLELPDPLGAVDDYFQEHLPGTTRRAPLPASDHGRGLQRVLDGLQEQLGLGGLVGRRATADWMPEVMGLLARVYGREPLDAGRPDHRRLAEACERLREAAGETRALPEAADTGAPASAAIRLLLSEVRDGAIPPEPVRPALEMLGWLELHLDDAPVLVVTGLSDEAVPGRAGGDPFLPDRLRRDLGLPHDAWRHGRDAYLLEAALRPRAETHLVVARRNGEGDPLRPSRLLLSGSGEELARRVRRLFDDRLPERAAGAPPGTGPAAESRFAAPPEPAISVSRVPDRLRVTDFRGLLQDPYRFALERLLGLEEQHDRSRELGGLAFGGLAHDVLRRFGESEEVHAEDPGEIRSRLDSLLDRAVRRRYGGEALPAVRIQVAQLRVRLGRFARWHATRVSEGWRVVATEVGPPAEEGVPFDVEGEPVHLTGRIDRIDRHEARGAWQVLDYKTGESPAHPDDRHRAGRRGERRWVDLQLPLYRHLLPEIARLPDVPDALGNPDGALELGYVNLSKEGVELALADWTEEEIRGAHRAAREAVMRLREGVFRYHAGEGRSFRDDPLEPLFRGHVRAAAGDDAAPVGPGGDAGPASGVRDAAADEGADGSSDPGGAP